MATRILRIRVLQIGEKNYFKFQHHQQSELHSPNIKTSLSLGPLCMISRP